MRLTEEQALQDDKRFESRNALAELKYCGWEIPQRRAITNDEIRFYAWLCRSAVALLKEQEAVKPTLIREGRNKNYNDYVCPRCDNEVVYEQNYCSECGVKFIWEGR